MSLQIAVLKEEHVEDAAALVSARYRELRRELPVMPPHFEETGTTVDLLRDLMGEGDGVVATRGSRLVGFLAGFTISEFMGKRAAYSPEWANGTAPGETRHAYEEMYGRLSASWVESGAHTHLVTLLSNDPAGLETWFWLGFGLVNVDGVRGLEPLQENSTPVDVHRATPAQVAEVLPLGRSLERYMTLPPIFWLHEQFDYEKWLAQPRTALWMAYEDGQPAGFMAVEPGYADGCQITQDAGTVGIAAAFTRAESRGRGIATALLNRSLAWAREEGYRRCSVDFESMNALASRFWMKWFEPVGYSLMRRVDDRAGADVSIHAGQ